jgi:hypothetical protein
MNAKSAAKKKNIYENYTPVIALAVALDVYQLQGFVRSGDGYTKFDDHLEPTRIEDNKTEVINRIRDGYTPSEQSMTEAQQHIDRINGKLMFKKISKNLTGFENSLIKAVSEPPNNYNVSILASVPHTAKIDVKREEFEERMAILRHHSEYYGQRGQRYDIELEVLDAKYIQSREVYMITCLHQNRDIVKFWWRDQPDLCDLINGKTINIRGTVNRHELNKFNQAKETMINRVKIISI